MQAPCWDGLLPCVAEQGVLLHSSCQQEWDGRGQVGGRLWAQLQSQAGESTEMVAGQAGLAKSSPKKTVPKDSLLLILFHVGDEKEPPKLDKKRLNPMEGL